MLFPEPFRISARSPCMNADTVVSKMSDSEVSEIQGQIQADQEVSFWKRFGTIGYDSYTQWVLDRETVPVAHFE
jgi:hypothetical protein